MPFGPFLAAQLSEKSSLQPRGTNYIPTATQPAFEVANDQILSPILIVLIGDRKSSSATLQTLTVWSRDPEMTMEPLCATSTAETSEPWQYLQYFEKKIYILNLKNSLGILERDQIWYILKSSFVKKSRFCNVGA